MQSLIASCQEGDCSSLFRWTDMSAAKPRVKFLPARRYASAGNSDRNVSVRLSCAGIVSKRRKLAA